MFGCFVIGSGLLLWEYPWTTIHDRFGNRTDVSVRGYLILAILLITASQISSALVRRFLSSNATFVSAVFLRSLLTVLGLSFVGFMLGPGGFDIPHTGIRGIFFAEWQFVGFLVASVVYAFISALILGWSEQAGQKDGL